MIHLIEDNQKYNYRIYHSDVIVRHHNEIVKILYDANDLLMNRFSNINTNTTWLYRLYNIFSIVSANKIMHDLFRDLNQIIKSTIQEENEYLWMQSWLNFHKCDDMLNWHTHTWNYHGYISVEPKKTKTIFAEYEVHNETGNIYIGPGFREHKVEVIERFSGERITLGFDVHNQEFPNDEKFPLNSIIPVL